MAGGWDAVTAPKVELLGGGGATFLLFKKIKKNETLIGTLGEIAPPPPPKPATPCGSKDRAGGGTSTPPPPGGGTSPVFNLFRHKTRKNPCTTDVTPEAGTAATGR